MTSVIGQGVVDVGGVEPVRIGDRFRIVAEFVDSIRDVPDRTRAMDVWLVVNVRALRGDDP
jgi:hypothetical protein